MGADVSGTTLPPGFVLDDGQPQAAVAQPALPSGFTLDGPPTNPPTSRVADVATGQLTTDIPRFIGTAAANVAAAGASLPRSVAQGIDWLGNRVGVNVGADQALASIHHPANPNYSMFPDYQTARDVMLGGSGATEYVPQSYLGRRAMDATTGAIGGIVGGPAAVIPSAAGSATAGGAAELFPNHPLIAAMLGFIPGAAAGKLATNMPQRVATSVMNAPTKEPYGAFVRQELPTNLAGTSTGDTALQRAEQFAARMPGSGPAVVDALSNLTGAWQNRFDQIASRLGTASSPQEVGTSLQSAARDWLTNFKDTTGKLWNDFYTKVPQDTQVPVTNYQSTLTNLLGTFPGASATAGVLRPGTVQALSNALGVDLQGGNALPWEALKNIRTAIGEKLENPSTVADTSQAALRQIYGSLTRDMEAGAGGVSPDALSSFHRANAATAAGHDLLDNHLNPILTAPTPEQATRAAFQNAGTGGTRLGALTFNLPSAQGNLSSYALRTMARDNSGGPITELMPDGAGPRPSALASALLARRPAFSPEAQAVLFPDQATRGDIADLATVGKSMQPLEKDLANSPTATHGARLGRAITAIELAREGRDLAGWPGAAAGFGLGFMSPSLMGRAAQATALNPYLSALYGRNIPMEGAAPSMLTRALIAPAVGRPAPPAAALPWAPATSANSVQQ